jgi:hypothetical protein
MPLFSTTPDCGSRTPLPSEDISVVVIATVFAFGVARRQYAGVYCIGLVRKLWLTAISPWTSRTSRSEFCYRV